MRVLVTGAAGFIGSSVISFLKEKGLSGVAFDNFSHSNYRNLLNSQAEVIWGDVCDRNFYSKIPKVDAVIHEAAITDTTLNDDAKMVEVNYGGFQNVFNFCLTKKIPLIYASSAGVYGRGKARMAESQKPTPHNTYAYSKYLCDCLTLKHIKAGRGIPVIGLRYFNVYGPGETHKEKAASMIYQLYNQVAQGKKPRLFKFGEQKRDFIYVKDVARITVECLNFKKSVISNLGTGQPKSFNEIISILAKLLKKNLQAEYFDNPYEDVYQNYTEADTEVLKKVLKNKAQYSLEEGITDYLKNILKTP